MHVCLRVLTYTPQCQLALAHSSKAYSKAYSNLFVCLSVTKFLEHLTMPKLDMNR